VTAERRHLAGAVVAAAGAPLAALGAYQLALAAAAFLHRPYARVDASLRVTVVVPAHDEATTIANCVRSLLAQDYPRELYEVVVVADNCTDDTGAVAENAGGRVLVRFDQDLRGKGHALRWTIDRLLDEQRPADAVAVVDADSTADAAFLSNLVRPLDHGAGAAQGESLLLDDGTPASAFRAAAFLLVNRVRPSGRAVLGLPSHLAGNGMLVRADVLRENPWSAYSSAEDLEYGLQLRVRGIEPRFAQGAILRSPTAPNEQAAATQQLRWEGGKAHLARTWIPRLLRTAVRERRPDLVDAAVELAVPPLAMVVGATSIGTAIAGAAAATGVVPRRAAAPWAFAFVAIPAYALLGLRAAGAPPSAYRSLVRAPLFVARKLTRSRSVLTFGGDTWVRTERAEAD
jgi:hypothetical protein